MLASRRDRFNHDFTPARYHAFLADLEKRAGSPVEFRVCETPCFFPGRLIDRLAATAVELTTSLLDNPDYRAAADRAVPEPFRLAAGERLPTFMQVDFGLVDTRTGIEGRLVELQAFPSLYGFQPVLAQAYADHWQIDEASKFIGGLDDQAYHAICRTAIVGDHDPADVVLMEVDPERQKTRPDFSATEKSWGVRAVDVRNVVREGRRLVDTTGGRRRPIARIYNRVIPDDLTRSGAALGFDFRDDLDVEWAGGPDWFFRLSKFSLPWLRHPWVPETHFLVDLPRLPDDGREWVLKPLFSFAGGGIIFAPTDTDLAAIPIDRRSEYILQRRVGFAPVIRTPAGPTQAEIRIMLVQSDGAFRPLIPLVRMGRGRMMGVDHNKGLSWVGASAALIDERSS